MQGARRLVDPVPGDVDDRLILTVILFGDGHFSPSMPGNATSPYQPIRELARNLPTATLFMTDERLTTRVRPVDPRACTCARRAPSMARQTDHGAPGWEHVVHPIGTGRCPVVRAQCCCHCRFVDGVEEAMRPVPGKSRVRGLRTCGRCGRFWNRDVNAGTSAAVHRAHGFTHPLTTAGPSSHRRPGDGVPFPISCPPDCLPRQPRASCGAVSCSMQQRSRRR